ncbi:hypothetical protein [Mesorhizobium denitrificans]|uniref:RepB-like DNA primase domain-containing protein n=1 Tax=Mesorhizobium denitrificans TaxID=2294114 RepID=A0A371XEX5_9HYPH|nr:hypothetical protein [Mesorhizobium denitrificans]RFC67789.1 hypothetical protein DY251_09355 [Mesorhizobium denitrificans]
MSAVPPEFQPRPDLTDLQEALAYSTLLYSVVGPQAEASGLNDPGCFYLFGLHPVTGQTKHEWFHARMGPLGARLLAETAIAWAAQGFDVWMLSATVPRKSMGKAHDLIWVFGLVIDFDGYGRAPFPESFAIQTSLRNGELHAHLHYITGMLPGPAHAIGDELRAVAKADSKTGSPSQKWRFPGTVNYKNPPQRVVVREHYLPDWNIQIRAYSQKALEDLLPQASQDGISRRSTNIDRRKPLPEEGRTFDEIVAKMPPIVWRYTGDCLPQFNKRMNSEGTGPSRHYHLNCAAQFAFDVGITPNEFTRFLIADAPTGYAAKFLDRGGPWELFLDVERNYHKWLSNQSKKQNAA